LATKDRKELKENFAVIYVLLMSLRSVLLWRKHPADWPRRITRSSKKITLWSMCSFVA